MLQEFLIQSRFVNLHLVNFSSENPDPEKKSVQIVANTVIDTAPHFSFDVLKKKIWANFQRIREPFTQKIVNKLSKIWIWDPGSGIRDPEKTYFRSRIPDKGVKKAPDPGSGSATLVEIRKWYKKLYRFTNNHFKQFVQWNPHTFRSQ